MSLIFNALQRFARAEGSGVDRQEAKPAKRNTQSLRRCLLSPRTLLTLGAAIVITGLIAVQLVQSLSANARAKTSSVTPLPAPDEHPEPVAVPPPVDAGPDTGAPGSAPPVQTTRNSSPADSPPSMGSRPEDGGSSGQLVFYPPEPEMAAGGETAQSAGGSNSSNAAPAEPAGGQDRSMQKAAPGIPDRLAALNITKDNALPETRALRPPAEAPGMAGGDAPQPTAKKPLYEELAEIKVMESKDALSEAAYLHLAARAAYQLNVTQLSHQITSAMQSGDPALVTRLMKELEKTQGTDSLFLIRLKAYWQIQQNHLEKARELLEQVLARKPDDKESGVNLAVVDMRAGRMAPARRRLEQLQHLYPEDDEIAAALQKLRR